MARNKKPLFVQLDNKNIDLGDFSWEEVLGAKPLSQPEVKKPGLLVRLVLAPFKLIKAIVLAPIRIVGGVLKAVIKTVKAVISAPFKALTCSKKHSK